jgi:hypothetical protein
MNLNIKIFLLCPVPEDQKPLNEYIGIKENPLTNWFSFTKKNYIKLFLKYYLQFSIMGLILAIFFDPKNIIYSSFLFTIILFNIAFYTNIFRWVTIKKGLNNSSLIYEEASWFDTQLWQKPSFIIKNDKLINSQKVKPILKRINKTLFIFILSLILLLNIL